MFQAKRFPKSIQECQIFCFQTIVKPRHWPFGRWRTPAGCHPPMISSVNTRIQGAGPKIVPGYTFSDMNLGMPNFVFPGHCETQALALWALADPGRMPPPSDLSGKHTNSSGGPKIVPGYTFSNMNPGMPSFLFPGHCETQTLALWRWRTPAGCHPPVICSVNTRIQAPDQRLFLAIRFPI